MRAVLYKSWGVPRSSIQVAGVTGHGPGGMHPGPCANWQTGDFCFGAIGEFSSGTDSRRLVRLPLWRVSVKCADHPLPPELSPNYPVGYY